MYKEKIKYRLIGKQPIGIDYSIPREEIAEYKNGNWYPWGKNKTLGNFIINEVIEIVN